MLQKYFLHYLPLPGFLWGNTANLRLTVPSESFRVVAAHTADKFDCVVLLLDSQLAVDYLVPCGVAGVPYTTELGKPASLPLVLPGLAAARGIVIVTENNLRPDYTLLSDIGND